MSQDKGKSAGRDYTINVTKGGKYTAGDYTEINVTEGGKYAGRDFYDYSGGKN